MNSLEPFRKKPGISREQRESELRRLIGSDVLAKLHMEVTKTALRANAAMGTGTQMIQDILNMEFPEELQQSPRRPGAA